MTDVAMKYELEQQFAAEQANKKVLLSAIARIKTHVTGEAAPNWSGGEATYRSRGYLADLCEVANQPTDDTALRQMLAAERERCAKLCDAERDALYAETRSPVRTSFGKDLAASAANEARVLGAAIRALGDE